jgi:pentatricopeptide repeat protein
MILGFLSECNNSRMAKQFYNHFHDLVLSGDPAVASLMETPDVWNLVLMTFSNFPDLVPDCPNVIGDMLSLSKDSPKESESRGEGVEPESDQESTSITNKDLSPLSEPQENTPRVPHRTPKPDVYTWSILLKIFMDHKQPRAAEKVIDLMTSNKVKPSIVTWSSLAVGYARMQDPKMTANAVDRLEKAGFNLNDITMRGLYAIHDRRVLLEAMKRKDDRKITATQTWVDTLKTNLREDMEDLEHSGGSNSGSKDEIEEKEMIINGFGAEGELGSDDFMKMEVKREDS